MPVHFTRRRFVGSLSAAVLAQGVLPGGARAASPARAEALRAEPLGTDLAWIRGAGANLLALRDPQGLVFIDGGLAVHASATLRAAQRALGRGRPHTLINTHWHAAHTGLNERLGRDGATLVAHENTRLWLSTTVRYQPDDPPIRPLPAAARPNRTTYTTGELVAGDETLRYAALPQAHTDGDLYVKLLRANVLVTGGVVHGKGWPVPDWVTGGWINGTVAGYRTLIAQCDEQTRVITAEGDRVYGKADLQAELDILAKLADQLARMLRAGFGPDDVLAAAPAAEYVPRLGDPTRFLTESFKSLWPRMAPDA